MVPTLTRTLTTNVKFSRLWMVGWLLVWMIGVSFMLAPAEVIASQKAADRMTVLALRPPSVEFEEVLSAIKISVEADAEVVDYVVSRITSAEDIGGLLQKHKPQLTLLMDNVGVNAYFAYQQENPDAQYPPSLVLTTLLADRVVQDIENSAAIVYEIPALTSLVNLRMVTTKPIKRVGVLYRESLHKTYIKQKEFCELEDIKLVGMSIDNDPSARKVERSLKKLLRRNLDALWIMNDSALLSKKLIKDAWRPALKHFDKPVTAGVSSLIKTEFKFSDYAVYPDHYGIGVQAAEVILDFIDYGEELEPGELMQPIAIKKDINVYSMKRKGIFIKLDVLNQFDRVLTE